MRIRSYIDIMKIFKFASFLLAVIVIAVLFMTSGCGSQQETVTRGMGAGLDNCVVIP